MVDGDEEGVSWEAIWFRRDWGLMLPFDSVQRG